MRNHHHGDRRGQDIPPRHALGLGMGLFLWTILIPEDDKMMGEKEEAH